jgi:hypothetical protein
MIIILVLCCVVAVIWFSAGRRYEQKLMRREWADLRVMKRDGDPAGAHIETRDWGARNDYGTRYRYEVRVHNDDCEIIESRRYLDPEKALSFHEEKSGTKAIQR